MEVKQDRVFWALVHFKGYILACLEAITEGARVFMISLH